MEPLIKSYLNRVAGEKAADARRATMSIVKTMDEERNAVAAVLIAATFWGRGLSARTALSLGLRICGNYSARLASRPTTRKAAVATTRDLIRGS
ncbi:MAG TPA: hypothetical protein VLV32_04660 [Burkholderiales bacterium]|nr:hypothetical protein [Burkholderiales bacterium]